MIWAVAKGSHHSLLVNRVHKPGQEFMVLHSNQEKQQQFFWRAGCQGPLSKCLSDNENHWNTLGDYAKIDNPPNVESTWN
jgi:hypothetical protein